MRRTHTHLVRAHPVQGAGTVEAVTRAYAAKYGDKPLVTIGTAVEQLDLAVGYSGAMDVAAARRLGILSPAGLGNSVNRS